MTNPRHALGRSAERAVSAWLTRCGWRVLAERDRGPGRGELDLVCLAPGGRLVGIEVRARRTSRVGNPAASVGRRRLRRLRRSLAGYASTMRVPHDSLEVEVVAVEPDESAPGRWRLRRLPTMDVEPPME